MGEREREDSDDKQDPSPSVWETLMTRVQLDRRAKKKEPGFPHPSSRQHQAEFTEFSHLFALLFHSLKLTGPMCLSGPIYSFSPSFSFLCP